MAEQAAGTLWEGAGLAGTLTPKFYVALTGTSSLISGLILIFEWWYFRKYGTSFIEQVSVGRLGSWLGGGGGNEGGGDSGNGGDDVGDKGDGAGGGEGGGAGGGEVDDEDEDEWRVWRNPQALLRGAEYSRLWAAARHAPLTYHDMNLSAQEHQAWFSPPAAGAGAAPLSPADEALARAWREREPRARVAAARHALRLAPRAPAALLLLAEEDAPTVAEAERLLRAAWRAAEGAVRAGGGARAAALLALVKRRAGMCLRRLGRLRAAARVFRELARERAAPLRALAPHENLLEVLLEQRAYPEASAALARALAAGAPRSACLLYTAALLRARAGAPDAADALRAAVRYNPHVPPLLLERRALRPPPEHLVRRGESEALAYAFAHLRHWRRAEPAARLLAAAWRAAAAEPAAARAPADRALLAPAPEPAPAPAPAAAPASALCALFAALTLALALALALWAQGAGAAAGAAVGTAAASPHASYS